MPPNDWQEMVFSEALQINPTVRLDRGSIYPYVDMASVNADLKNAGLLEEREFKGGGSKFQSGDTLMARITPCLENGKIAQFQAAGDQQIAHGSTEFIVIRGRENVTDHDFVYYLTRWNEVRNYAIGQMTGTSGRQRVPVDSLEHLTVEIPPLAEQCAIAQVLSTLDDKIDLNRRMNQTLKEMARALFKSWFVDFEPVRIKMEGRWRRDESLPGLTTDLYDLFPDRLVESEAGVIPKGWEIKTLGDVTVVVGGTTPSTKVSEYWEGGKYNWATPKDLATLSSPVLLDTERKVTDAGLDKIGSGLLPVGTLLLSSRAPIGYLAISEKPVAINQGFIAMPPMEGISNLFLLYWCEAFHDLIIDYANGSTFLEISKRDFRRIPMVMPDEAAMTAFVNCTRPLHEQIVTNECESRTLAVQRDALLPKLVSGDLRL